ncbi:MAG: tRNA uridine(34) 5-carboxymethylaminomethyl modification radical SAM/GNAT enzyme Elp3 [Patescibacteria group bacterium]
MSDFQQKFENIKASRRAAVLSILEQKVSNEDGLQRIVRQICAKYKVDCLEVKKSHLVSTYREMSAGNQISKSEIFERLLTKRRIRTMSGVSVISVMTKPMGCPGNCVYCPSPARMPKSYLENQPAAMRGVMNDFDPYEQVRSRLIMLDKMGHDISKNEMIVLGGTFSAHPVKYQELFIKRCFDAFNNYKLSNNIVGAGLKPARTESIRPDVANIPNSLSEAKKINETADCRLIGLTIETRPDYITPTEAKWLRYLGVTRVELGVQSVFDDVLNLVKRGHNVEKVKEATAILRQAGFKIVYHIMPGLPGTSIERDKQMFRLLFSDPGFYPDHLKIYPTVVLENSELFNVWQKGEYKPYQEDDLIKLFGQIKPNIPPWVRIVRLMRDIPNNSIVDGVKTSNLRQKLHDSGVNCNCIRCREPKGESIADLKLIRRSYHVRGGQEIFLSYESIDDKKILALLRLFIPQGENELMKTISEIDKAALVRELHTYGQVVGINKSSEGVSQHQGWGKKLMQIAEEEVREAGYKKMAVIAGVGVRQYYQKLGYKLVGEYMVKSLV